MQGMIRPYKDSEAPQLAELHNLVYPAKQLTASSMEREMAGLLAAGGLAWVIFEPQLNGYARVSPVPGLPGVGDLAGCIRPERQRSGLGSELLQALIDDLRKTDFWQIAHHLTDLEDPAARFLGCHGFFVEHEEWQLALDDLSRLPVLSSRKGANLRSYPRDVAIDLFCRLYEESFKGLAWDQPFEPSEVDATLKSAADLLFLCRDDEATGFAWVDVDVEGKGLIEPLGIVPAYQQQGYGRILLESVLRELKARGARRVEIGAWRENKAAIQLYQSSGFRHQMTYTYLAYNLQNKPS